MTRRYFTIASLSLIALTLLGCGDDNEPIVTAKIDPLGQNDTSPEPAPTESDYEADGIIDGPSVYAEEYFGNAAQLTFTNKGTYKSYGKRNGGRSAWRIPKVGRVGSRALVRFPSGKQYLVIIGKANRSSNGFVFKKGSHGGWYIHAPYGDSSTTCTVYWS